ncbi:hypothetical protein BSL78_08675 [Apostichopus japonicus]|uniref:Reverse transcriptase domain-containing protein n=1 Tax=Stichopus japonicus TaxID=307972 RepID=A0A2G8L2J9_STIJA|nr:hypothetical protein BSL78_08675 [Apostichopus japonicus]
MRENINLEQSILNASETESIYEFLDSHRDAFSLYGELSHCPNYEADITLTNDEPFYIRPYRLSDEDKVIVASELDKLVRLGILAVGHQSYTSPVFLIPKKGTKDKRVVTDFRYLNSRIKRLNHPFPLLNETIRTIGYSGAKILGVLDLKSAFFCLPLSVHAQQYTEYTFQVGYKKGSELVLADYLSRAPQEFHSEIDQVAQEVSSYEDFSTPPKETFNPIMTRSRQGQWESKFQIYFRIKSQGVQAGFPSQRSTNRVKGHPS